MSARHHPSSLLANLNCRRGEDIVPQKYRLREAHATSSGVSPESRQSDQRKEMETDKIGSARQRPDERVVPINYRPIALTDAAERNGAVKDRNTKPTSHRYFRIW